jgi:hydrogenase maturation protein HypF
VLPVIGVALDGTGYGTDGTIWGGEFMIADINQFKRVAHFATFPLPGGEAAIREPMRAALGLLVAAFGESEAVKLAAEFLPSLPEAERKLLAKLAARGGPFAPKTSSAGRLFDAVAALLGFAEPVTYEGQAAIRLQALAGYRTEDEKGLRPVVRGLREYSTLSTSSSMSAISFTPFLSFLFNELRRGTDRAELALAFHVAMADAVTAACRAIADQQAGCMPLHRHTATPPHRLPVALSGGVLQNTLLLDLLLPRLEKAGFMVLTHRLVPPNDACIALGQAAIALARQG